MQKLVQSLVLLCISVLTFAVHASEPALLTRFAPGRSLDDVTESLKQAIVAQNYTFVRQQAIDGRLVPTDWEAKSVRIVYFCNFAKMDAALRLDARTAHTMPCRITLVERKEGVDLIAVNPAWTSETWSAPAVQQYCQQLKADYQAILEEASLWNRLLYALCILVVSAQALANPMSASKTADMPTALVDLSIALENHGYQLVKVQPVDQALVKRGFADPGIRLAFVGKAEQVRQAMDVDPALLNLLPLRLTMERENGEVRVSSDDLDAWRTRLPAGDAVIKGWQGELAEILADYVSQ